MLGKNGPAWLAELRKPGSAWRRPLLGAAGLVGLVLLGAVAGGGASAEGEGALDTGRLVVDVLVKLGLVLVLIYASLYLLRRWQGGALGGTGLFAPRTRQVTLLETTRLSPRQALHLVRAGGQVFLLGATDQG
ncbi:MAG: flagellar biosynthetic protein FliO, partial [Anaerolineales bacterium]|nr:flagellar biosynthetic protein FliO [Anaerolineales bacterium]